MTAAADLQLAISDYAQTVLGAVGTLAIVGAVGLIAILLVVGIARR